MFHKTQKPQIPQSLSKFVLQALDIFCFIFISSPGQLLNQAAVNVSKMTFIKAPNGEKTQNKQGSSINSYLYDVFHVFQNSFIYHATIVDSFIRKNELYIRVHGFFFFLTL